VIKITELIRTLRSFKCFIVDIHQCILCEIRDLHIFINMIYIKLNTCTGKIRLCRENTKFIRIYNLYCKSIIIQSWIKYIIVIVKNKFKKKKILNRSVSQFHYLKMKNDCVVQLNVPMDTILYEVLVCSPFSTYASHYSGWYLDRFSTRI